MQTRRHAPNARRGAECQESRFYPKHRDETTRFLLTEHVPSEVFADEHYADQLVERMGWALVDAEQREQKIRG
jgi:hypothetical protein